MPEPLIHITAHDAETGEPVAMVTVTPLTERRASVCGEDFCEECGSCLGCSACTEGGCACSG